MNNNAHQPASSTPVGREPSRKRIATRKILIKTVFALFFLVILISMMLPAVQNVRIPDPKTVCRNSVKQIALGLLGYENANGHFPPAYIADENGKPMHSWRVLILPHIEEDDLYQRYSFDEPWNGPNNSKLHDEIIHAYRCPSSRERRESEINGTNYVVVTGPRTAFPFGQSRTIAEIADGISNTIGLVEISDSNFHWMKPEDRTVPQILAQTAQTKGDENAIANHSGKFSFALLDSSTFSFYKDYSKEAFEKLLRIDDGGTRNEL